MSTRARLSFVASQVAWKTFADLCFTRFTNRHDIDVVQPRSNDEPD